MADQQTQPRAKARGGAKAKPAKEPTPKLVEYVVLRLLEVKPGSRLADTFGVEIDDVLSEGINIGVWVPVMEQVSADGPPSWRVRKVPAPAQEKAIEAVTGKAEEATPGTWRAISWSAWKGVTKIEPPRQVMLDVRSVIEED